MKNYETVFILDPALSEESATEEIEKAKSVITGAKGELIDVQKWGKRKLAYEIKKKREGIYALVRFKGTGEVVGELERSFRLTEPVLRFLTVVDAGADEEKPEAEGQKSAAGTGEQPSTAESAPAPESPAAAPAPEAERAGEGAGAGEEKRPASPEESVSGEAAAEPRERSEEKPAGGERPSEEEEEEKEPPAAS